MTGAGFAGCGVALVAASEVQEFTAKVETAYQGETGRTGLLYACRPVKGARLAE
jgi:galactokinase